MSNVDDLKAFIKGERKGAKLDIATSQYASNTTAPGYTFDYQSTAPAVRSLERSGLIKAEYRWRYYEVTVL